MANNVQLFISALYCCQREAVSSVGESLKTAYTAPHLWDLSKKILWDINSEISREEDVCLFDSGWNLDQDVSAHLLDVLIWLPVRTTAHPMCYNYTTAHQCFLDALASLGSLLVSQ